MRRRGFTLMEMLAVVAVIALTAAIAVPAVGFLRDSWIMRQRNAHARTVFLTAQNQLSQLRAAGGLDLVADCDPAVPQMGEPQPEGLVYAATGDRVMSLLVPESALEEDMKQARIVMEWDPETASVAAVFFYQGTLDIGEGYRSGQLPRDAASRRKLLLGYWDGRELPEDSDVPETVAAELVFENGQEARVTVLIPTQTSDLTDLTGGNYRAFQENLEVYLTVTGERGGEIKTCIKSRGSADNCRPGSTEGGMEAVAVTALLDSLRWAGSLGGGILPGDNVSVTAEITAGGVRVESAVLPGINPLFASLTEDGSGGLRINVTNGRHLQNLNKLSPQLAGKVSAVVFTGPEGTVGKGDGIRIDWQETSEACGGLDFTPISNEALLENADFVGNEAAICNLRMETDGVAGLFSCLNTAVDSLYLVDPEITSAGIAGALAARVGESAEITNCGVFCETSGAVRGKTAGGLVGICGAGAQMIRCFAAVDVEGETAGGFAGESDGAVFDRCYASGTVRGMEISGGFLGRGEASAFTNCFATGDAAGFGAVGGFAGCLRGDEKTKFHSCYSLGLAIRGEEIYENFCGRTEGNPRGLSDYYKGYAEAVLSESELKVYRFKDCYYLAGNYPGGAYGDDGSRFWANPMDYDTLGNIRASGSLLLERLMETPFDSPEELEKAKEFLNSLDGDLTEILEQYRDCGTYQIYFDAGKALFGDTTLKKTYRKAYSGAFPAKVWETGETPFPVLKGVPYYGVWPGKQTAGDYGILYYEICAEGVNLHQIRLSDGQETAVHPGTGPVLEAGYALYCQPGTLPFSEETWAMTGKQLDGILPETVTVLALSAGSGDDGQGNPIPLQVSARYWGRRVTVVPEFADTLNRTGDVYQIRCQSQLEAVARYPRLDYVLDGEIRLDGSYQAIPEFFGSLTGTGEIRFEQGNAGLVDTLRGGTLEGLAIRGNLTLSGTAGCFANRVTEGGRIRDCSVSGEIGLENAEIFGPVVGILEEGTVLRTQAQVTVTGAANCQGAFLGQALGGAVRDCQTALPEESIAFAGFAASEETAIANASHVTLKPPESSRVDPSDLSELTVPVGKITYKTAFEGCVFQAGETAVDALKTYHYYSLTLIGGWNRILWESETLPQSGRFLLVTQSGELLQVKNGMMFRSSRWDLAGIAGEDLWSGGTWESRGLSVTVEPGAEGTFCVSWQEPVAVSWKAVGESELHTREESASRQAVCRLYEITENTDCRAIPLETVQRLWIPWEDL